jgi:hypothetical protein
MGDRRIIICFSIVLFLLSSIPGCIDKDKISKNYTHPEEIVNEFIGHFNNESFVDAYNLLIDQDGNYIYKKNPYNTTLSNELESIYGKNSDGPYEFVIISKDSSKNDQDNSPYELFQYNIRLLIYFNNPQIGALSLNISLSLANFTGSNKIGILTNDTFEVSSVMKIFPIPARPDELKLDLYSSLEDISSPKDIIFSHTLENVGTHPLIIENPISYPTTITVHLSLPNGSQLTSVDSSEGLDIWRNFISINPGYFITPQKIGNPSSVNIPYEINNSSVEVNWTMIGNYSFHIQYRSTYMEGVVTSNQITYLAESNSVHRVSRRC